MEYFAPMKNARVNDFKNISSNNPSDQGIKDNVKCSSSILRSDNVANTASDITVNITDHSDDNTDSATVQLQASGNKR